MKRITLLLSFVFMSVVAFGQSVNYSPEELERLQLEREQTRVEAEEPSLDRAPFTSASIPPGHTQIGFRDGDIGYAWNIWDNNAGVGTGPVTVNLDDGALSLIQGVPMATIWMAAGDFADETWYGLSNETAAGLYTIDPATGDYELVGSTGLASATGLAYDVTSGIMYLSQHDGTNSQLYEVDLASAEVTHVGMITDGIIIAIAVDSDGNIYGAKVDNNSLYAIDSATGAGTLIGELGVPINFAQDIGYDRDNGILYGTLYGAPPGFASTGGLYEIDTETGLATLIYNFLAEVAGFGIPYISAEDGAPGHVTDYTVEPGDNGALEAHLAWTNPALTFDGETLTELTAVHVERNGDVIHTIDDPVIGGEVTFNDETVPEAGVYNYCVFGVNSIGEGPKTSIGLYIGEDVPAAPGNLTLVADGNDGHLSWDAPTEGYNGGYLSSDNITYTVVRMPEETVVAEDIEATEFLDTTVPEIGNYYYTVTASNHIGEGGTAASNDELLGAEGILMFETFDYPAFQPPPDWEHEGAPHSWRVWNSSNAGGQAPELRLNWSPSASGMSRLITYPINVEGYSGLRFSYKQFLNNRNSDEGEIAAIDITFDGGETWDAIWEEAIGTDDIPAGEYVLYFEVPDDETEMHFAIRFDGYSANINQWFLDDMVLQAALENDLIGVSITGNTLPSEGIETIYTVTVENAGTVTQDDYTVKLMGEDGIELASVPGEPIGFGETIVYEIPYTPMEEGPMTIYGYVEFSDDEVPDNNQTPFLNIFVQPADIQAVTIGDGEVLIGLPYNFFWHYSLSQTIYYPEEIGLSGGVINGILYTNSFNEEITDNRIQIWMGETEIDDLTEDWIDPSSFQLVFDGPVYFPEGVNEIFIPLDDTYAYSGGNLVIHSYKQDDFWASGKNFYNTLDAGSSRTRNAQRDDPFDPMDPDVDGFLGHHHPNITMFFSTVGLGTLEGTVTEDGEPVEGVNVRIIGAYANAQTDADGFFEFPLVHPGTYDLQFTKFGYYDAILEDIIIEEEETTVVTTEIEAIPTVSVMGTVVGSDFPEIGIPDAAVTLTGFDNYEAITDADGHFVIEGVYIDNDYTIQIQTENYETYTANVDVGDENVDLDAIIVIEIAFPVGEVVAEETDDGALVSWELPGTGVVEDTEGRVFESFRVYRLIDGAEGDMEDWAELVIEHPDTFYLDTEWENVAHGLWRYAVIAEYTNENLSDPEFSNILPKDMTVPFTVNVSTNSGDLTTDATVHIINMNEPQYEYEAVVPETGIVDFPDVWRGFYALTIQLRGFETYYVEDIDITEAATYDAELIEIIVAPFALNVETSGMPHGDALFFWNTGDEVEFRYDDGIVDDQIGWTGSGQTWNSIMGAVHHRDAQLWEVTWQLTEDSGPHNTVKVWIIGLTDDGFPDRNNIIYTAEDVPNTDGEWNTYELTEPLLLHDGFFIGLSYPGFIALAVDDGVGEPWEFVPNTQLAIFDITDPAYEFTDIAFWGFEVNFLLRGYGLDFGPIDFDKRTLPSKPAGSEGPALSTGNRIGHPYDAGIPEYLTAGSQASNRALEGFNVFLDGEQLATEITETEYLFTGLDEGSYVAGVQSVYTTGESEIVTKEFLISEISHNVTFNVDMSELEDFDPDVHSVYMTGTFTGWAEPGTEGSIELTEGEAPYFTANVQIAEGTHEYKYFSDAIGEGWDGGEWDGDPNRELIVEGDMEVTDIFGVDPHVPDPPVFVDFPFFDDFNDADTYENWVIIDGAGSGFVWELGENSVFAPEEPFSGGFASVDSDGAGSGNTLWSILEAPVIDLANFDDSIIELSFDHHYRHLGSSEAKVLVSADGETWEEVAVYDSDQGSSTGFSPPFVVTPVSESIQLDGFADADYLYLRFEYNDSGAWAWYWLIDNVSVDVPADLFYTVTFDVVDEEGLAIEDAVIVLGPFENAPGDYVFHDVPAGTHEYTVNALCFSEHGGEIVVEHDVEHEVELALHIMPGDANGDGVVNVLDILAIGQYYIGNIPADFCFYNADVNGDGEVNIIDIIAIANIFANGKFQPYPALQSSDAHIYMGDEGIMLHSDGSLAGIQFEITGDVAGLELKLELPKHEIMYVNENGTIKAIIFSMDNTPFPAGLIDLVSFDRTASPGWLNVLAGNLNADEVPVIIHNDEITGIDDVVDLSFNAYPNPATDVIYVDLAGINQANVSLINVHGQIVETQSVTGDQQISFNTGNLPSGIYMLRLEHNDDFIIERIMVK